MNTKDFEHVIDKQLTACRRVLVGKAQEYAQDDDRLHNFRVAAGMHGSNMRKALAGMMAKHTVSVYDMCNSVNDYPIEMWDEKITDHINYLLLLRAIVAEDAAWNALADGNGG